MRKMATLNGKMQRSLNYPNLQSITLLRTKVKVEEYLKVTSRLKFTLFMLSSMMDDTKQGLWQVVISQRLQLIVYTQVLCLSED